MGKGDGPMIYDIFGESISREEHLGVFVWDECHFYQ